MEQRLLRESVGNVGVAQEMLWVGKPCLVFMKVCSETLNYQTPKGALQACPGFQSNDTLIFLRFVNTPVTQHHFPLLNLLQVHTGRLVDSETNRRSPFDPLDKHSAL